MNLPCDWGITWNNHPLYNMIYDITRYNLGYLKYQAFDPPNNWVL
jgi:hypothetical protein